LFIGFAIAEAEAEDKRLRKTPLISRASGGRAPFAKHEVCRPLLEAFAAGAALRGPSASTMLIFWNITLV
jgi:hypothetical protein